MPMIPPITAPALATNPGTGDVKDQIAAVGTAGNTGAIVNTCWPWLYTIVPPGDVRQRMSAEQPHIVAASHELTHRAGAHNSRPARHQDLHPRVSSGMSARLKAVWVPSRCL